MEKLQALEQARKIAVTKLKGLFEAKARVHKRMNKRVCPYCSCPDCEAEWVHNGVGYEQATAYSCPECNAEEISPYSKVFKYPQRDHDWLVESESFQSERTHQC